MHDMNMCITPESFLVLLVSNPSFCFSTTATLHRQLLIHFLSLQACFDFLEFYRNKIISICKSLYEYTLLSILLGKYLRVAWLPHLVALAVFHNFWFVVFSVSFNQNDIVLLISSLIQGLFSKYYYISKYLVILQIFFCC